MTRDLGPMRALMRLRDNLRWGSCSFWVRRLKPRPTHCPLQDDTTWVEQPLYAEVIFSFHELEALAAKDPKLKDLEPFKTVRPSRKAGLLSA
jgi:hypothetical protein